MSPGVWWAVAMLLIVLGVLGTFIPGIPGPVAVFAGMLLAAWIDHFSRVGWVALLVLAALTAAALAIDTVASVLGARRVGASRPDVPSAVRVGVGTWIGLAVGAFAKIVIVLAMLALFLIDYFVSGT